jgi:hypothetical protein
MAASSSSCRLPAAGMLLAPLPASSLANTTRSTQQGQCWQGVQHCVPPSHHTAAAAWPTGSCMHNHKPPPFNRPSLYPVAAAVAALGQSSVTHRCSKGQGAEQDVK